MIYSKIKGCGSYLPKKILTNADLESTLDTTDEWITTRTGIKKRHIVAEKAYLPARRPLSHARVAGAVFLADRLDDAPEPAIRWHQAHLQTLHNAHAARLPR